MVDRRVEASDERVPVFNIPRVIIVLIAILVVIQGYRMQLSPDDDLIFLAQRGFVPARLALALDWLEPDDIARAMVRDGDVGPSDIAFFKLLAVNDTSAWLSPISYSGVHGGWEHLILNSLWFLAFGSVVARRLGTSLFLAFVIASSIASALFYGIFNLNSALPLIGASGVVSAAMGAALLLPFSPMGDPRVADELQRVPLRPIAMAIRDRRVVSTTLIWFALNALFAFGLGSGDVSTHVAWEAHIGGYLAGMGLIYALDPHRPVLPEPPAPE